MVARQPDDGSIADLPWGSVFDPAINARALNAVQARGFRAARELVDRFLSMASEADFTTGTTDPENSEPEREPAGVDLDRVLTSWQGLVGQLADAVRGTGAETRIGPATFDLRAESATGRVLLETEDGGAAAVSGEVWLHNGGPEDLGKVRLRCSDLLAPDGALNPADCVRFEPDTVPMPARSSRGITMEIDVDDVHPAGTYRGTVLAEGHPDVWLPVTLVIGERI